MQLIHWNSIDNLIKYNVYLANKKKHLISLGTMGGEPVNGQVKPQKGSLYSFENKKPMKHLSKLGISNGLAWSADKKKMFYIDTHAGSIDEFDYDIKNGTMCKLLQILNVLKLNQLQ